MPLGDACTDLRTTALEKQKDECSWSERQDLLVRGKGGIKKTQKMIQVEKSCIACLRSKREKTLCNRMKIWLEIQYLIIAHRTIIIKNQNKIGNLYPVYVRLSWIRETIARFAKQISVSVSQIHFAANPRLIFPSNPMQNIPRRTACLPLRHVPSSIIQMSLWSWQHRQDSRLLLMTIAQHFLVYISKGQPYICIIGCYIRVRNLGASHKKSRASCVIPRRGCHFSAGHILITSRIFFY